LRKLRFIRHEVNSLNKSVLLNAIFEPAREFVAVLKECVEGSGINGGLLTFDAWLTNNRGLEAGRG
jgi:hypothetical protein